MHIEVVCCPGPRECHAWTLDLPPGAVLADAIAAARALWSPGQAFWDQEPSAGIWGRKHGPEAVLHDRDRVEVYRPLRVDPKVARRERFNRQGARSTGLFAQRRPGAKAGY